MHNFALLYIEPLTTLPPRNSNGDGILLYVREDIHSKLIKKDLQVTFKRLFIEINLTEKTSFLVTPVIPIKATSLPM